MSDKSPWWQDLNLPLNDLIETFGCDPKKSPPVEAPDKLSYNIKIPIDNATKAFPKDAKAQTSASLGQVFNALRDKYSSAITLTVKSGDWTVLSLDKLDVDDLLNKVESQAELVLDLTINKQELIKVWQLQRPHVSLKIYFSPDALVRELSGSLSKLEENKALFHQFSGEEKFIILVPEYNDLELNGEYLTVLGGTVVARWEGYLPAQTGDQAHPKIDSIREHLLQKPRWTGINVKYLTPIQLFVDWPMSQGGGQSAPVRSDPIAQTLFAQLTACSLLHVAGNSRSRPSEAADGIQALKPDDYRWTFTFAADKYLARVEVKDIAEIAQALIAREGIPWDAAQTIARLANWIYGDGRAIDHRLIVVQVVIASSLQDNTPSDNLREIIRTVPELAARIYQRWDDFMEDKLDKYFLHLKELEETVDGTTKSYNEQVDSLTKTLTDNMLAAVGVLVGTFIAAIFQSPFKVSIFLVGAGIYLAYLIIFPIRVGLRSALERFKSSRAAFHSRQADFIKRLSKDEVSDIVKDTVRNGELRFRYWFLIAKRRYKQVLITFVVLMIVALLIGVWQEVWRRRESFDVSGVFYRQPATSEVVPLLIQGNNFDKDKDIVITIGDSSFPNTEEQSVKVHGSNALMLSARQEDLTKARDSGNGFVFVRQDNGEVKKFPLPSDPAPIPYPVFEKWNPLASSDGETIEAYGFNFSSISEIEVGGAKLNFKTLNDGRTLRLSDQDRLADLRTGKPFQVRLKNGERLQEAVSPLQAKPKTAKE